jgi:thioredoxin-related protein
MNTTRTHSIKGLLAGVVALLLVAQTGALAQDAWTTDYAAALKKAKAEKKAVLLDFTGSDWCGWCVKLKDEVFSKKEFKEWATKKVVLVELDFPKSKKLDETLQKQNAELKATHKVRGYPTIVFVDAEGVEIGRTGYVKGGPEEWIKKADEVLAGGKNDAAAQSSAKPKIGEWTEDFDAALKEAKAQKKRAIVDFTGSDWCGWCVKLKSEVFDTTEFKDWAKKNAFLVELDFPRKKEQAEATKKRNRELLEKHGVEGFPTILVFDGDGKVVGKLGYVKGGPKEWIAAYEKAIANGKP